MRHSGTFNETLGHVRGYLADSHGKPHDCVIRILKSGVCEIESRLEREDREHICISFDDFVGYWYDLLNAPNGVAPNGDIDAFKKIYAEEND